MPVGLYLFCLAQVDKLPALPLEARGIDGEAPVQTIFHNDIAGIWSSIDMADFVGPTADERLQDLAWIGPRVIRHQEVVAAIMRHSPVLPARFGTIFSSLPNLEQVLRQHCDKIAAFLDEMAGKEEWGVKGLLDRSGAKEKLYSMKFSREADRLEALSPGKRYFEEQRLRAGCNQELQQWLQEACQRVWYDIQDYAAEIRERSLLSKDVTGTDKDMVFNWSLLVPSKAVQGFQAVIHEANAKLAQRGLVLECTGPWPPYSFCPCLDLESEE